MYRSGSTLRCRQLGGDLKPTDIVKRIAKALEVSRSQLHERLRNGLKPRRRYQKTGDAELLEPIRRLMDERPTYAYRRIGAVRSSRFG